MRLSDRLMMSLSMIPEGARVADIGCDHGKSSIYLVKNGITQKQIAMDLREGPLAHARENIAYAGLSDKIECRLSDGIQKLEPGEVDTLLICGMGGMLTIEILSAKPEVMEKVNALVLQPQADIGRVREYIMSQGFEIIDEKTCFELGKFYNAMLAKRKDGEAEKPGEPGKSGNSGKAEKPGEAKEPEKPENSEKPGEPKEPEKPDNSEKLGDSEKLGETGRTGRNNTPGDEYTFESDYAPEETEFGKILLEKRDPVLREWLEIEYRKALKVIDHLSTENTDNARERLEEYRQIKALFEKALSRYS